MQLNVYYGRMVGKHNFQKEELTMHYFKVRYYLQKMLLSFDKISLLIAQKIKVFKNVYICTSFQKWS